MTTSPHASSTPVRLVAAAAADGLVMTVVAGTPVADGVVELTLAEAHGHRLPDWSPGSHIDVVLPGDIIRQYSLCGDRWDPFHYRIAVLREPLSRGGSRYIHDQLAVGDALPIGGPRNNFALVPAERYLFVAGGIGITPILPMCRQADLLGIDWTLIYVGRSRRTMAYLDDLADDPRVRVHATDEGPRPDLAAELDAVGAGTTLYCCGPVELTAAAVDSGAALPVGAVRVEHFVPKNLSAPVRSRAFEVELRRSGQTVTVPPDRSILEAVSDAGVAVLSSCRQGTCGTCDTGVLDGRPDHRDSLLTDSEREQNDCMFICVSRSCTDTLVLDL